MGHPAYCCWKNLCKMKTFSSYNLSSKSPHHSQETDKPDSQSFSSLTWTHLHLPDCLHFTLDAPVPHGCISHPPEDPWYLCNLRSCLLFGSPFYLHADLPNFIPVPKHRVLYEVLFLQLSLPSGAWPSNIRDIRSKHIFKPNFINCLWVNLWLCLMSEPQSVVTSVWVQGSYAS